MKKCQQNTELSALTSKDNFRIKLIRVLFIICLGLLYNPTLSQDHSNINNKYYLHFSVSTDYNVDSPDCSWLTEEETERARLLTSCSGTILSTLDLNNTYFGFDTIPIGFSYYRRYRERCFVDGREASRRSQKWDFNIQIDSSYYGRSKHYKPDSTYDNVCLNDSYSSNLIENSWLSIGVSPPRPDQIVFGSEETIPYLVEKNTVSLKPKYDNNEIVFPDNSSTFGYQMQYSTTGAEGTWVTINDPSSFTVPDYVLLDVPATLYLRAIIFKNGAPSVVKYSPYCTPVSVEVRPRVVTYKSYDPVYCNEDSATVKFDVKDIKEGEKVLLTTIVDYGEYQEEDTLAIFNETHSNQIVPVRISNSIKKIFYKHNVGFELCAGYSDSLDIQVSQPTTPLTIISQPLDVRCNGDNNGQITLSASGGASNVYTYYCNGISNNTGIFNNLSKGNYTVKVVDSRTCGSDSMYVDILQPEKKVTLTKDSLTNVTCNGKEDGKIVLTASGGWSNNFTYYCNDSQNNTGRFDTLSKGSYTVMAIDSLNCKSDSQTVTVSEPAVLSLDNTTFTNVSCLGAKNGSITPLASGGTEPYTYSISSDSFTNLDAGKYTVTVVDSMGCSEDKEITISQSNQFPQPNLPELITLCTNQTYIADAGVPAKDFIWLSNNGFSAITAKVELVLPGEYYLMVTDDNGCTGRDTLRIESYAGLIDADFLMTDKAFVGDTIVLIEMSWPIPQSIEWVYPIASFSEIFSNEYSVMLIPLQEGNFNIGLVTSAGPCTQYLEKPIIIGPTLPFNGDTKDNLPLFKEVAAYPNPNNGNFELFVDMNRESNIMVEVFTMYGNRVMFKEYRGLSTYKVPTTINQISGMYLVRVTSGSETQSLRIVIQ